jgi:hypothetical protein
MSDLQVSLLIIGAVVVGGVTAFNWFQQWRLRRRLENAFGEKPEDVLLREPAAGAATREPEEPGDTHVRVEPTWGASRVADAGSGTEMAPDLPPVPGFDLQLDYVVALDAAEPISTAGLAELHTRAAACGRRFRVMGYSFAASEWEEAARLSGGRYAHLRLALQLVSRRGPVDLGALTTFCAAAQECAERFAARASCPDIEGALGRARQIDAFCAEVDVAIGVNVVASGAKLQGARIRALAEAAGFRLVSQGVFVFVSEAGEPLFTLDNQEPQPFLPDQVKSISTTGITLLLDVPRVADGYAALDLMIRVGGELARELGATLVDDNRKPLTDASVGAIRQQLKAVYDVMAAHGIPPGGERALRLFS